MAEEASGKKSFWRRKSGKGPGNIKSVPHSIGRNMTFTEFESASRDAWGDIDEEDPIVKPLNHNKEVRQQGSTGGSGGGAFKPVRLSSAKVVQTNQPAKAERVQQQQQQQQQLQQKQEQEQRQQERDELTSTPPYAKQKAETAVPSAPETPSRISAREERFRNLLNSPTVDLDALRQLTWSGAPASVRPTVWRLLSGYLPANLERRASTLARKRSEYTAFIDQYFGLRDDEANQKLFHQIHIDVPRMNPAVPTFQQEVVQRMFERILFIWAIRHPGSGYVQGINDLVTPFFAVFLSEHIDVRIEACNVSSLPEESLAQIEADTYWCMTKLLDGIHDNYTFAQPGIQTKVKALEELVGRIDAPLNEHLEQQEVHYLQFAFRWMNCLLMREIPLQCVIRLWDTYHAEPDGFASFHLYVCAAFLETFSKELLAAPDFQTIMVKLQNTPTENWDDSNIELVLAEAYRWKYMFHDARKHLG